jgi:hypothetical protein
MSKAKSDTPLAMKPAVGPQDLPPLSEEDQMAWQSFQQRQQALRSLTLGCIEHHHTGAYIYGPPGDGKSFTVHNTLRERKAYWQQHQRITAKPLYMALEQHPGAIHVIDDCEQLFNERSALTLLRSVLGGEMINGRRERRVCFSVTGAWARELSHYFYGAIIFTSNRPLADEKAEVRAVLSRMPSMSFAPPDHELRAVMRVVARRGYVSGKRSMSPLECVEVIEYVIALAAELKGRLDLRWVDHSYGHYLTQTSGGTVDWRDMVKFHIMGALTCFDHPLQAGQGADETEEIAIAQEIAQLPGLSRDDRLARWTERTGLSRPTYYRRLAAGSKKARA